MSKQSLKEILEKHSLDVLRAAGIVYKRKLHEKNLLMLDDQARAAIVEAVEGLKPENIVYPKLDNYVDMVKKKNSDEMYEYGFKMGVNAFLQAIKEWQGGKA